MTGLEATTFAPAARANRWNFSRPPSRYRSFLREVATADLPTPLTEGARVTEADLAELPAAAQRYMRFMGVVGRPRDWSFVVRFHGRFRRRPGEAWMPCDAWQYNSMFEVARIFVMRIRFAHVLSMVGRDTYIRGHGRMRGKLLGLVTVVDGYGEEFDIGELVTCLNDAVLLAPSMLLAPSTSWSEVDDRSFDVTLTDAGHTVTARVLLDERGAPRDFQTEDRNAALNDGLVRAPWTTPVKGWELVDGRPFPGPASAVWQLPDGPFTYIEGNFVPGSVRYNVAPGE
jgi:hypothetical protein